MSKATGRRSAVLAALMATGLALATAPVAAAAAGTPSVSAGGGATGAAASAGGSPAGAVSAGGSAAGAVSAGTAGAGRPAIIGGRPATESYPFMVSFQLKELPKHHCGGALVAADWVVTAAHCKGLMKPGRTQVRIGSLDREVGGVVTSVKRVVTYGDSGGYGDGMPMAARSDIALVQLDRRVNLAPVRIAAEPGEVGEPSRVIGWGMTCEDRNDSACTSTRWLQELDTVRVADGRCADLGGSGELCIGERDGRAASSCHGDSGGPLIRRVAGRWELVGATSRDGDDLGERTDGHAGCSTNPEGGPGVGIWTDVTHYRDWIADTVEESAPLHDAS
ncbi:S1 family peptidase [Nonomuraea sp. NPDC004354]